MNAEIDYQVLLRTIDFERPERNKLPIIQSSAFFTTSSSTGSGGGGSGTGGLLASGGIGGLGQTGGLGTSVTSSSSSSASHHHGGSHHHHHYHHHGHSQQQRHLIDVYFVITGVLGSTKKIYMNNYEIKRIGEHEDPKEKYFEFKSEDVGKLSKINVSINQDDDPGTYLYVDFIEIKIPSKSEAYK